MSKKNYYHLKKGDEIKVGDEVFNDTSKEWELSVNSIGGKAPDPCYTSHRRFRREVVVTKFECSENDTIIEHNEKDNEVWIFSKGEKVKTIVGVVDLKLALEAFGLCEVQRSIRGNVLIDQIIPSEETKIN